MFRFTSKTFRKSIKFTWNGLPVLFLPAISFLTACSTEGQAEMVTNNTGLTFERVNDTGIVTGQRIGSRSQEITI